MDLTKSADRANYGAAMNSMTQEIKSANIDPDAIRAAIQNPAGFETLVDSGVLTAPYIDGKSIDEIPGFSPTPDVGVFPEV